MARPKTDAQFQAEMDAQTLISAEQIKGDRARMSRAKAAAKKVAADAAKAANTAKKVAGGRVTRKKR